MLDLDFSKLFDLGHWFEPNPGFPSAYYYVIAALYLGVLAFGVCLYLVYVRDRFREHRYKRRSARRVSIWAGALGAVGLLLLGLRFAEVPFVSARILLYLMLLVSLGALGYFLFYWKRLYPGRLAAYEDRVLKARYAPKPKPKSGVPPSAKRKAKARKAK